MWEYTIFGRKVLTVSDRTYDILMSARGLVIPVVVFVAIAVIAVYVEFSPIDSAPMLQAQASTPDSNVFIPADVEPEKMIIRSHNHRFAWGSVKIRSPFGKTTANFTRFCHSDGCEWRAEITNPYDLFLPGGPYLLTAYDACGDPVATFRLDRTGTEAVEVIKLYLLNNPPKTPMLSIGGVDIHYQPLGRETYVP